MNTAFCFDLDGTVTATDILPCIAADLGLAGEMAALSRVTMDGHMDFEDAFRLRCAILGGIPPSRVRAIVKSIPLTEPIVSFVREHATNSFLVTGNVDAWVAPIVERCGVRCYSSQGVFQDGRLSLMSILDKRDAIHDIARNFDRTVAIGHGANDVPMLQAADIGIAYGGAHSPSTLAVRAARYIVHDGETLCTVLRALS